MEKKPICEEKKFIRTNIFKTNFNGLLRIIGKGWNYFSNYGTFFLFSFLLMTYFYLLRIQSIPFYVSRETFSIHFNSGQKSNSHIFYRTDFS